MYRMSHSKTTQSVFQVPQILLIKITYANMFCHHWNKDLRVFR